MFSCTITIIINATVYQYHHQYHTIDLRDHQHSLNTIPNIKSFIILCVNKQMYFSLKIFLKENVVLVVVVVVYNIVLIKDL